VQAKKRTRALILAKHYVPILLVALSFLTNNCQCGKNKRGISLRGRKGGINSNSIPLPGAIALGATPSTLVGDEVNFTLTLQHKGDKPVVLAPYSIRIDIQEKGGVGSTYTYTDAAGNPVTIDNGNSVNKNIAHFFSQAELSSSSILQLLCSLQPAKKVKEIKVQVLLSNPGGEEPQQAIVVWEIDPKELIDDIILKIVEEAKDDISLSVETREFKKCEAAILLACLKAIKNGAALTPEKQHRAACAAAAVGSVEVFEVLLKNMPTLDITGKDDKGATPLHYVSNREMAKFLLDRGADPNLQNSSTMTPFQEVIGRGLIETVEYMATRGADVANRYPEFRVKTLSLHLAILNGSIPGQEKIIELLIKGGIDINSATEGKSYTPLHFAILHNNLAGIKLLLQRSEIRVNAINLKGSTALHLAARRNDLAAARLLLAHRDIQKDLTNNEGKTPLQIAIDKGNIGMIDLLTK
jgi:ankyrin repeat protein